MSLSFDVGHVSMYLVNKLAPIIIPTYNTCTYVIIIHVILSEKMSPNPYFLTNHYKCFGFMRLNFFFHFFSLWIFVTKLGRRTREKVQGFHHGHFLRQLCGIEPQSNNYGLTGDKWIVQGLFEFGACCG